MLLIMLELQLMLVHGRDFILPAPLAQTFVSNSCYFEHVSMPKEMHIVSHVYFNKKNYCLSSLLNASFIFSPVWCSMAGPILLSSVNLGASVGGVNCNASA